MELTPTTLNDHPELGPLELLRRNLELTGLALQAAYPNWSCGDPEPSRGEREAFASTIFYLIEPLVSLIEEYRESVRREEAWIEAQMPAASSGEEICKEEIPF